MRANCKCGNLLIGDYGLLTSDVIILSDAPGYEDVKNGQAYSGQYGEALKTELGKVGIQPSSCHMMTLWLHSPSKDCDLEWHIQKAMPFLMKAKLILMLGSECLSTFTGFSAMEVSGTIVKSKLLKAKIVAGPSVAALAKTPIGELRLALELFANQRRMIK
jgi:uracil-DNA glycosylase